MQCSLKRAANVLLTMPLLLLDKFASIPIDSRYKEGMMMIRLPVNTHHWHEHLLLLLVGAVLPSTSVLRANCPPTSAVHTYTSNYNTLLHPHQLANTHETHACCTPLPVLPPADVVIDDNTPHPRQKQE